MMDFAQELDHLSQTWSSAKLSLTKKEVRHIADQDHYSGKLLGLFTIAYAKRGKLIRNASICYGYAFREYYASIEDSKEHHPTWVLFSPSSEIQKNPLFLKECASRLLSFSKEKHKKRADKRLSLYVQDNLAECSYVELPASLTEGKLVYLSILYARENTVPVFHLGLNLLLANRSISKEVLYLPTEYWSPAWAEYYRGEKKEEAVHG